MIDVDELVSAALALYAAHPEVPARRVLDAVMSVSPGCELKDDPVRSHDTGWLGPRGAFAEFLRQALAPEVEPDFVVLLDDPDPEVRLVFEELWRRAVIERFGRAYLGWK
ncbi:MAG TPA: hypothetical protein VLA16_04675 [Ideonella sp.]|nr:hypothetical protein [Ideonella sp.]